MPSNRKYKARSIAAFLIMIAGFFCLITPVCGSELTGLEDQGLVELGESQMADLRGGYLGFYFSITFSGFWDTQGNKWADINYKAGFDKDLQSGQLTVSSSDTDPVSGGTSGSSGDGDNPQFTAKAILGGFNNGNGVFQVNQVPGSNNIVQNGLVLNLTIYNISESQAPAVMESLKQLAPGF